MDDIGPLQGCRVLVIEDEFLLAETLTAILEDAGAVVVGPFAWCDDALAYIDTNAGAFDVAVLDVNLNGTCSYPIADVLIGLGIRFVFTTGYDAEVLDRRYKTYPRCLKPFGMQTICDAVAAIAA